MLIAISGEVIDRRSFSLASGRRKKVVARKKSGVSSSRRSGTFIGFGYSRVGSGVRSCQFSENLILLETIVVIEIYKGRNTEKSRLDIVNHDPSCLSN